MAAGMCHYGKHTLDTVHWAERCGTKMKTWTWTWWTRPTTTEEQVSSQGNSSSQGNLSQTILNSCGILPLEIGLDIGLMNSGHGTYIGEDESVIASVAGTVNRVNKLLSVKSLKFR